MERLKILCNILIVVNVTAVVLNFINVILIIVNIVKNHKNNGENDDETHNQNFADKKNDSFYSYSKTESDDYVSNVPIKPG